MAGGAHGLDHLEDALAHPGFADLVVGPHQFQGLALDQGILFLRPRPDIGRPASAFAGISSKK
jgi:hypothetical protein